MRLPGIEVPGVVDPGTLGADPGQRRLARGTHPLGTRRDRHSRQLQALLPDERAGHVLNDPQRVEVAVGRPRQVAVDLPRRLAGAWA